MGNIVDRGPDGIKILEDIIKRKNIIALRGNHDFLEYHLLKALISRQNDGITEKYSRWIFDGGLPTQEGFNKLNEAEQKKLLMYMSYMAIYEEIEVNGNKFFLSHTVPSKERMRDFDKLLWQEFIIGEPEYEKVYFSDKFIVTGHTPTGFINPKYKGKIRRGNNHIAIDCGSVFGNPLGCICLDTLEEFYVGE